MRFDTLNTFECKVAETSLKREMTIFGYSMYPQKISNSTTFSTFIM